MHDQTTLCGSLPIWMSQENDFCALIARYITQEAYLHHARGADAPIYLIPSIDSHVELRKSQLSVEGSFANQVQWIGFMSTHGHESLFCIEIVHIVVIITQKRKSKDVFQRAFWDYADILFFIGIRLLISIVRRS